MNWVFNIGKGQENIQHPEYNGINNNINNNYNNNMKNINNNINNINNNMNNNYNNMNNNYNNNNMKNNNNNNMNNINNNMNNNYNNMNNFNNNNMNNNYNKMNNINNNNLNNNYNKMNNINNNMNNNYNNMNNINNNMNNINNNNLNNNYNKMNNFNNNMNNNNNKNINGNNNKNINGNNNKNIIIINNKNMNSNNNNKDNITQNIFNNINPNAKYKNNANYNISSHKPEIKQMDDGVTKLQFKLEEKDKEINKIKNECISKIQYLNKEIDSYKKQVDNLNLILSSSPEKISELIKYNLISKVEINNQKSIIDEFMPKYDGQDPLNFYDIIVDINSIKKFDKGWNIYKSKKKIKMSQFIEENSIKIGVVGNGNKGKSFLLSKISDIDLPIGESIKTKGLSIKFPQIENHSNRTIILLDSAGQETPVLNNDIEDIQYIKNQKQIQKSETNETSREEKLTEKSRDKLLTEFFLQNYIVKFSDLLIIVVGILTFSEQKLINKIKKTYLNSDKKGKKAQLIVIHNLQSYVTLSQVENYIKETLLKSDTFKLKEKYKISKEMTYNKENKEAKWRYFYEPNSEPNTIHLIFAREKSEAGNFYNRNAIEHLYEIINTINEKEPLNVCENIKNLFVNISNQILETPIEEKDIEIGENIIKFKKNDKNKDLVLKKCSIDELGLNNFSSNGFNPYYCYYAYNSMLYIIVEVPGEINRESFQVNADCDNGKCIIKISGNKIDDIEPIKKECQKLFLKREFGKYSFNIVIEDININTKNGKLEKGNGLIKIIFPIIESSSILTF